MLEHPKACMPQSSLQKQGQWSESRKKLQDFIKAVKQL